MNIDSLLAPINAFLQCETPDAWVNEAKKSENLQLLLTDHMVCELKAAQTAMWLIRKYAVDKESGELLLNWLVPYEQFIYKGEGSLETLAKGLKFSKSIVPKSDSVIGQDIIDKMVLLIKEELHHFYQVLEIMTAREIPYQNIRAGRYAKGMMKHVRTHEPATLVDKLICGAYIEARSCERFAKLAPHLDEELQKFYVSLLRSEARHFQDYLSLAQQISDIDINDRVVHFGQVEAELITSSDPELKFHSGSPC
ncbi:MAG: tRNA isopentenyl-2-thiomethyl-A-37 hydroxylase MiaE [Colwellia sp.]